MFLQVCDDNLSNYYYNTNSYYDVIVCIVIVSTYAKGDALHIGITNSLAKIYAFDEGGVRCFQEWPNCLAIRLVSPTTHELEDLDQVLDASKVSVTWAAARLF